MPGFDATLQFKTFMQGFNQLFLGSEQNIQSRVGNEEGIFRVPGSSDTAKKLLASDSPQKMNQIIAGITDINDGHTFLKTFFRDLLDKKIDIFPNLAKTGETLQRMIASGNATSSEVEQNLTLFVEELEKNPELLLLFKMMDTAILNTATTRMNNANMITSFPILFKLLKISPHYENPMDEAVHTKNDLPNSVLFLTKLRENERFRQIMSNFDFNQLRSAKSEPITPGYQQASHSAASASSSFAMSNTVPPQVDSFKSVCKQALQKCIESTIQNNQAEMNFNESRRRISRNKFIQSCIEKINTAKSVADIHAVLVNLDRFNVSEEQGFSRTIKVTLHGATTQDRLVHWVRGKQSSEEEGLLHQASMINENMGAGKLDTTPAKKADKAIHYNAGESSSTSSSAPQKR